MRVVGGDPRLKHTGEGDRTSPCVQPEAFLLPRAHHPLGVGVPLGVVIAGKGLLDPQRPTSPHKGHRRRLTAIITHQRQALALDPLRELAIAGPVEGQEPMRCGAAYAGMVTDTRLGIPLESADAVDPPNSCAQDFGHLDAPPLVGPGGCGLAPRWCPWRFQP